MADQFSDFLKQNSPTPGNSTPTPGVSAPAAAPASGGGDAFSSFLASQTQSSQAASPAAQPTPNTGGGDSFSQFLSSKGSQTSSSSGTPTEHDESDRFTQDDPGANWLEKGWGLANKPLTESLFGWGLYRHGAGGVERAIEKTASSFTAPLSLGLIAAFAPAGIAEGVAGTALKEGLTKGGSLLGEEALDGLTAAQKVEAYAKAVDAAQKARIAGGEGAIEAAVTKQGLGYQEFLNMGQYLRNQGMNETDVLGESFARRAASQGLRKVGVTPGQALRVAKGAETLVNFGFGAQMVHGSIYAFPKAFDLLSNGDYNDAAEYLIEGGLGTVFGTLGIAHGLHSIGDIIPSLNEKEALPLSDETEAINKVFGHMSGDITASQAQIAARKRSHLIGLMEIAGLDVPAGLRDRVELTDEDKTRLTELQNQQPLNEKDTNELLALTEKQKNEQGSTVGAEIQSAISGILASPKDREALSQAQKNMFMALDSGNDRVLAHQKLRALAAGTKQEDWVRDVLGYKFMPPERTLEDIANEEKNGVLAVKTAALEGQSKINDVDSDIKLATSDLKKADATTAPDIQARIDQLQEKMNDLRLEQDQLDKKYEQAKVWENPATHEEAFKRLYEEHLQEIKEAYDRSKTVNEFNDKIRALGNYPKDLALIEERYPHFRDRGFTPESVGQAPNPFYLFNPEFYTQRLENPELVENSASVSTPHGEAIAVPVGGSRRAGSLDYLYSEDEKGQAEEAVKQLQEHPEEFPNARLEKTGREAYEVKWGENPDLKPSPAMLVDRSKKTRDESSFSIQVAKSHLDVANDGVRQAKDSVEYYKDLVNRTKRQLETNTNPEEQKALEFNLEQNSASLESEKAFLERKLENQRARSSELVDAQTRFKQDDEKYTDAVKGKLPEDQNLTSREKAEALGKLYGYKPEAIQDFLDAYKQHFKVPDITSAKRQTLTQKFKNWFRNSRVVDENNDPLVVFHGTAQDWDTFDPRKAFLSGSLGFHAGSISQARDFVTDGPVRIRPNGKIMPVFLSIQNPLRMEDLGNWRPERMVANLAKYGVIDETPISQVYKPDTVSEKAWNTLNPSQQRLYSAVNKQIEEEIASGKLKPISEYPESYHPEVLQKYTDIKEAFFNRERELRNKYVIDLIEQHGYDGLVYKNFAEGDKSPSPLTPDNPNKMDTSGDSYLAFHPNQIKSAISNSGEFSRERESILENKIYDSAPKDFKQQVEAMKDSVGSQAYKLSQVVDAIKKREGDNFSHISLAETPEWQAANKQYEKLLQKLDQLQGRDSGEVHKFPNGDVVTYLSPSGFQRVENLLGRRSVPNGTVFAENDVKYLLNKLRTSKSIPDWEKDSIESLVKHGQDKNGAWVIAAANNYKTSIGGRLWTLREELLHGWQYSLGKAWSNHLTPEAFDALKRTMPSDMLSHLNKVGYKKFPSHMKVIEAAAKFMATAPERTMMKAGEFLEYDKLRKAEKEGTLNFAEADRLKNYRNQVSIHRAQAKAWMDQYFRFIKEKHGDNAFDELTHTTNLARKWNEDFRNAEIRGTRPRPDEENVGPVGAEGAGGSGGNVGGGGPPKPPEPPEPEPEWDGDWRKLFPPSTSNGVPAFEIPAIEPWQDGPQHPALPADLVDRVNKAKARNYTPQQLEYIQSILKSYAHVAEGLSPQEQRLYKALRGADDDNWSAGYNNGIIHSIVDNHIHHIWGDDPKKGYPSVAQANSGAFAINATQARHRSWNTAFEGILDGRQLKVHDPTSIIANDADQITQASAHRKALELLAKGRKQPDGSYITLKDPEGMPILTFRGMGREVPGEDGSTASILVNPNVVKNILMQPSDIKRLTDSGLLDTYLRDGRVVDKTPQVGQGNVKEWIAATQKKLQKLQEKNPLLGGPEERLRHEAGWGQLQLFAKNQAQKITEYLDEALSKVQEKNPDAKGNYPALSEDNKPDDITLAKYLGDVLHGKNRRITPPDFERLEAYLERNRNYANGLSSDGGSPIRPHEVSRLLRQEREHLDPELTKYLDEIHDHFGEKDSEGVWSKKGLNTAIYHIAHAAENTEYPQLMKDLADLKHVDNVYTSVNPITQQMHKEEAMKLLKDINERQPKQYLWAPKSHITIDHPSFHGYKWMASAADGTPTLAESDMAVSRHYYRHIINRLGLETSWLRKREGLGKLTEPLLRGGAQVKSTILSGSPFHVIQIALRALMLHVNPFVRPNPISNLDEAFDLGNGKTSTLRKGVENSLTLFTDKNAAEDHSVGVASHGGLVSKIPIYGPFTDQIHDFLFNRFIPSVKADAYKQMYKQYSDAHPDWSEDAAAYHAAQHTNNAFGGINWREMGRASTTQDWFNLVALAPDWLESEMRFGAGLFNGVGIGPAKYQREEGKNFTRTQVGQAAVVLWTTARLLNSLYSGKPHYETPFGLVVKDKDGRDVEYSVRTLPTDILHAATDPYGFLVGRTSPLARTGEELVTGRNQYGQKLTASEKYVDMISNLSPIWGQAGFKKLTNLSTASDVGGVQQMVKAAGGTASIHRTPAELTAAKLASERSEEGSINPAQIVRHRLLIQLEENVRSGKIKALDLQTMVDHGDLPEADAKTVIKVAKETTGLDPEQARMYSRTSRLDFAGADQVYQDANPSEKQVLHNLIVKKAKSYIKKSLTEETPATRAQDPMFKQARRYAPLIPEPETVQQ